MAQHVGMKFSTFRTLSLSEQESVDPQQRQRLASQEGGAEESSGLTVALPPLSSPTPLELNDPNLPPPPPYESVAKIHDKDAN